MSRPPLRIGVSIYMFKPGTGGLQSHAEQLCRHLAGRGHKVVLITRAFSRVPHFRDYLFFNEAEGESQVNDVCVRPLRFSRVCRSNGSYPNAFIVRRLRSLGVKLYEIQGRAGTLQAFDGFDVIHHVGQATALIGFAASIAVEQHIPFVAQPTCHPRHVGDSAAHLQLYARADRLLVHTKYEGEYLRQAGIRCPIDVVGNGIEDRSNGREERFRKKFRISGPFVLYIGRKMRTKGIQLDSRTPSRRCGFGGPT